MKRRSPGWLAALAGAVLYAAAAALSLWGTGALYGALARSWGLSGRTYPYAPGWMRALIASWGSLAAAAQGLLCLGCAALAARFFAKRALQWRGGHFLTGAGIGCLCALAAFALLRLTDSVRSAPSGGTGLFFELSALAAALGSALAPEALIGGLLWPEARGRWNRWICLAAFVLLDAAMYAIGAPRAVWGWVCLIAQAAACAALYERSSWLAAAGLRAAWHFVAYRLCGFSATGAGGAFLETFPVSRDWLTGGDLGLEGGVCAAALFFLATALIWLRGAKTTDGRP